MAKFNYIPLASVIARVIELVSLERTNEKTLYKWASDGVKLVYASDTLKSSVCFAEVTNYKAKLPSTWKRLVQILYNEDSVGALNPLEIFLVGTNLVPDTIAETNPYYTTTVTPTDEELPVATTDIFASNNPLIGQPVGTYIYQHDQLFVYNRPLQSLGQGWNILPESTSRFHQAINCGIDLTQECGKHTYSYDKGCNSITTSFETGWVCIAFLEYPKCDEGFQIPDFESKVPQALEAYLLMKVFEKENIKGVEGSGSMYKEYQKQWEILCAAAKGNQKMLDADQLENIKNMLVRLAPHHNTYQSGFGNSSDMDNMRY